MGYDYPMTNAIESWVNSSKAENSGIKIPSNIIVVPERESPDELCRVEDMSNSVKKSF